MIPIERRMSVATADEEWRLLAQLFDVCPLGLRVEAAADTQGITLHVEAGSVSRHDQLLLLDLLADTLAATAADPSAYPKPALPQSHRS